MTLPTQKEIELPLLQEIAAVGGEAKPQDLYPRVTAHFPQITEADRREKVPSGANKWTNLIQFARQRLVEKGEIDKSVPGMWIITEKGRERLKMEGFTPGPKPSPNEADKLMEEIKSLVKKLVELAKKETGKTPLPSHDELAQKLKEMGEMLSKTAEIKWGPVYKHDCIWKDNLYANPKLVMEVCDKGNLDKDIASLIWANTHWMAKGILVTFEESDFNSAQKKLAPGNQIYPMKAEDMVKLHYLLQAGNVPAVRTIFGT